MHDFFEAFTISSKRKPGNHRCICNLMKRWSKAGVFKHVWAMLLLGTPSLFLSPAAAVFLISSLCGVASKGQVFRPTGTRSFVQNLLPARRLEELLHEGSRVGWKRGCSARELVCRSWLGAKTGRFPSSGAEKPLLLVEKTSHPVCSLALHSTLCWGVTQTVNYRYWFTKKLEQKITSYYINVSSLVSQISFSDYRQTCIYTVFLR